ncbi:conserved hypothetical protein [Trichophyton verrucosum HKI 0517]|uniref:Autophagy-related protein 101 n=1 Tax=Trichophyton verrucosum (strain HKI 0517) TaxID=663202 RepID=D4DCQ4_TRIVH|nr:uncharacterized protein TRV_04909 [Trichophyton verrucosum HKI 0517]EFE40426.1 conserved hypothetical protein [Trichophyton verrucosum HKI 0517]
MDPRKPPEHILEIFADRASVKEIVKGVIHAIFFHRYFPCVRPDSVDVLDLTLPVVDDLEVETLIDARVNALIQQHLSTASNSATGGVRSRIAVQFFEKRRKKSGAWFTGLTGSGDEEVCWEIWTLDITIATPRTELDRAKVRKAMEKMLRKAALKIVAIANKNKDHIPPITSESNPFPYQIVLNPKLDNWGNRLGLY